MSGRLRICNPTTRDSITLPQRQSGIPSQPGASDFSNSYFGYDPIRDEHKALKIWLMKVGDPIVTKVAMEVWVFPLGAYSWNRIAGVAPHNPFTDGVCIDGTLYYGAYTSMNFVGDTTIVAFNVGLEKFEFIAGPPDLFMFKEDVILTEWKGHLGVIDFEQLNRAGRVDLEVLEDPQKRVWSNKSFTLPPSWRDVVGEGQIYVAGTVYTGEIILVPQSFIKPVMVFFYDANSGSVRGVTVEGLPDSESWFTELNHSRWLKNIRFTEHVESIFSMEDLNY